MSPAEPELGQLLSDSHTLNGRRFKPGDEPSKSVPSGQDSNWSITYNGSLFARIFSYEGHAFLCTFGNLNQSTLKT